MAKQLARTVYVTGDDGARTTYAPGTPYSDKLGKIITNPSAWVDDTPPPEPEPAADGEDSGEGQGDSEGGDATEGSGQSDQSGDGGDTAMPEPPRSGQGSGREAWAEFARSREVTVPEGASRDDIIAFLAERGIVDADDSGE